MASARRLSWLALAFGALALAVLLAAAGAVGSRVSFALPPAEQLLAACADVLPSFGVSAVAVLGVLAAVAVVAARAARAAVRQAHAQRRLHRCLDVVGDGEVDGVRFHVIASQAPEALCAGLLRPRVYVSEVALDALDACELRAVLAHEDHHRRRRDPLRLAAGALLADAFVFVPALGRLHERYQSVAELAADEAAVRRSDASVLASALMRFAPAEPSAAIGIAAERVDHLLGERPGWNLPILALVGSLGVLAVLLAAAAMGATTTGPVNIPMALMGSCAILMTVAALAAVVGGLVLVRRPRA